MEGFIEHIINSIEEIENEIKQDILNGTEKESNQTVEEDTVGNN
jgi:hypothetical protein